jgi:hyperosmotically inducible protein
LTVDARRDAERAAGKESERVDNRLVVRPAAPLSDAKVGQAVVDAILREPRYGVFDSVGVAVEDGVVRLVGSVRQPWLKDALDRRVANLDGVRDIHNEIRVAPTSTFDDRLRAELVRRIYGDDMFARYANWAHPPIRIVVENGRVTLTGAVGSPVEQVRLGMIARGTLSFGVVNEVEVEGAVKEAVRRRRRAGGRLTIEAGLWLARAGHRLASPLSKSSRETGRARGGRGVAPPLERTRPRRATF